MVFSKLLSRSIAKKMIIGGAIGFVVGFIMLMGTIFSLYDAAGDCVAGSSTCEVIGQQATTKLASILTGGSLSVIATGVLILIVIDAKKHRQVKNSKTSWALNSQNLKRFTIKLVAFVAVIFVSGTLVSVLVANLLPILFSAKTAEEQARLFAYTIIAVYPVTVGASLYLTNKWLTKKLP